MAVDWAAIEDEYKAGQLSIREIGRQHNVSDTAIRKYAKAHNLQRDLSEEVRKEVRNKLVRTEVCKSNATDKEIVEVAATRGAEVIKHHRRDIAANRQMAEVLREQLDEATKHRGEIEEEIWDETKEDKDGKRRQAMLRAVSLPSHAGVLRDLSVVQKNLIPLERQAFSLDNDDDPDKKGKDPREVRVTFVKATVNINVHGEKEAADRLGNNIGSWISDNTPG